MNPDERKAIRDRHEWVANLYNTYPGAVDPEVVQAVFADVPNLLEALEEAEKYIEKRHADMEREQKALRESIDHEYFATSESFETRMIRAQSQLEEVKEKLRRDSALWRQIMRERTREKTSFKRQLRALGEAASRSTSCDYRPPHKGLALHCDGGMLKDVAGINRGHCPQCINLKQLTEQAKGAEGMTDKSMMDRGVTAMSEANSEKILPCFRCGSESHNMVGAPCGTWPIGAEEPPMKWSKVCSKCGATGGWHSTEAEAIAAHNVLAGHKDDADDFARLWKEWYAFPPIRKMFESHAEEGKMLCDLCGEGIGPLTLDGVLDAIECKNPKCIGVRALPILARREKAGGENGSD